MKVPDTQMYRQWLELKEAHPDCVLFFRMGDFYELFFDDAVTASAKLGLTLTSRDKGKADAPPMAGVPCRAVEEHVQSLVDLGYKVAVADQVGFVEGGKGLMKREVVRVVTPGTGLSSEQVDPRRSCWLVSVSQRRKLWGLALLDVTTGDLRVVELDRSAALEELGRIEIRELLMPSKLEEDEALRASANTEVFTCRESDLFLPQSGRELICERLRVKNLRGFGCQGLSVAIGAAGAAVHYAEENTRSQLPQLRSVRLHTIHDAMILDPATRRNLELLRPLRGQGRKNTLLGLMDRCGTAMGSRLLREWLQYPLMDHARIEARLNAVEALVGDRERRDALSQLLPRIADLERIGARTAQGSATPRDLGVLRDSLRAIPELFQPLRELGAMLSVLPQDLCGDVRAELERWLIEHPPQTMTEGEILQEGVDPELDEWISLSRSGAATLAALETREREATQIQSLKIRYNKTFGYVIEVTAANLHKVPERFLRKQVLSTCERYVTPELKELEEKLLSATERRSALEYQRFLELRERIASQLLRLQQLARSVASVDVFYALAELAVDARYVRPELDEGRDLEISGGRHPVVEQASLGEPFVANDLSLRWEGRRQLLLTGPNMAGKSTLMRQVALITLMAQMGSFVPADRARIGICDRIFTRVGASDDLSSGQSTFMVEMSETANILHHATERSLILLDEIGRGTSTFDGLAIAWSVSEDIHHRIQARCVFATHYHELVSLFQRLEHASNISVAVSEWGERIIFLRRLQEGGASRSYGIQCARLAGVPEAVLGRARVLLEELEQSPAGSSAERQLSLFQQRPAAPLPPPAPSAAKDPLREALARLEVDDLTPREAHAALYQLHDLLKSEERG